MENILQKVSALFVIFLFAMTSVAAADIKLTYPVGGEYIANEDGEVDIAWDWNEDVCGAGTDSVTVQYYNGISWIELTRAASAEDESFDWFTSGLHDDYIYQIRLISSCNSPDDVSESFTLDSEFPTIDSDTLLTPNGGELLAGGDSYEITWDDEDITDLNLGETPIALYYSENSGVSYTLIVEDEANDGSYMWTVPLIDSDVVKVRIEARDLTYVDIFTGHSVTDESDDVFTIDSTAPTVTDVEYSDDEISEADDGDDFSLTIEYSEDMDTSVEPSITFDPSVEDSLVDCAGHWLAIPVESYEYECTVEDADEEADVSVMVMDAEDLAGNEQESFTDSEALWIDTLAPEVESVTAYPDPTNGDVEITVDFTEDMDSSGSPDVYLSFEGDDTLYSSVDGGAWEDADSWVENFELVSGDYYPGSTIDVSVSDANDLIGNSLETGYGSFVLDNVAPIEYSAYFDDYAIDSADAMSTSFTYYYAEEGTWYYYTITDEEGNYIEGSGEVVSSTDQVAGLDVSGLNDGTLMLIFWLMDDAGNEGDAVYDWAEKDSTAPSVVEILTSEDPGYGNGVIAESDADFWVWVSYDESMNSAVEPSVSFDPSLDGTLSCTSGWGDGFSTFDTYFYACSVTDSDLVLEDVDVSVSGGEDAFGNDVVGDFTREDAFDVDLVEPWVTDVEIYPEPAAEGTVTFTVSFSEAMDTDAALDVHVENLLGSPYAVTGDFLDSMTWEGTFELEDDDEETIDELSLAYVYIEDGEDLAGNVMDTNIWSFSVDTVNFYAIDIPGGSEGFTEIVPNFLLSIHQLEATNLEDYYIETVLDSSAGPLDERLVHEDVSMVWAYDGDVWASYDVDAGTGDFTSFDWTTNPAYYELELKDSAQGKAIRHDEQEED